MSTRVVAVGLASVNVHAVVGERTILVDTGFPGGEDRLLRRLFEAGVDPGSVSLIVVTHCHPDHAGGAAALRDRLGVPVAVHEAEAAWAASGTGDLYRPLRPFGRLLRRWLDPSFPAFPPDLLLREGTSLESYGAPVEVLHTPGHTPGSISLLERSGGQAVVGDLLAGGMLRRDRPAPPFLAQETGHLARSVRRVLATGARQFHFGHGRPSDDNGVRGALSRL